MSYIGNDIFKYEHQWCLFKGNEYMNKKLHQINPIVLTNCPKSFIINKNMRKNNLEPIFSQFERDVQNKCFHKKLHYIYNSNHNLNEKRYYLNKKFLPFNSMISNKVSKSILDKAEYNANNRNLSLRIKHAKSFFKREKLLRHSLHPSPIHTKKTTNWSVNLKLKNLSKSLNVSKTNHNLSEISTGLKTLKTFDETNKKTQSVNIDNKFTYYLLNEELIEKDKKSLLLFIKKIFIPDFGLINSKIMYYYNKMLIIIEPFSSLSNNTFLIQISGEQNLDLLNKVYSSYDSIMNNIIFDKEGKFILKKNGSNFNYVSHVMSRDKFKNINIENENPSFV